MARIRTAYSESHDYSKNPPRKGKRRASSPAPYVPGPPPDMNVGFLPKNLSEEQRRELRARQIAASQVQGTVPYDPDIQFDPDLQNDPGARMHPRAEGYPNQWVGDGEYPLPFPEVRGDQLHLARPLPPEQVHPPLPNFKRASSDVESALELIAAVSADDRDILAFDNKMSDAHMALRNLRQAADNMVRAVARKDEKKNKPNSVTAHARNLSRMLSTIIEPWFGVLEQEFEALLNGTSQAEEMEG